MTIGEYIKQTDRRSYYRLINMFKEGKPKKEPFAVVEIKLGCSVEELMKSDSYKREGRRVKRRGWG